MDQLLESPHPQSSESFWDFYIYMRWTISFLFASTLLVAGLAYSVIGIVQARGFPFVFFNGLILIAAGGVWLLDKFVLPSYRPHC